MQIVLSRRHAAQFRTRSSEASSATAGAASPLTSACQEISWPFRLPFGTSFMSSGAIVRTYALSPIFSSRFSGFSSFVVIVFSCSSSSQCPEQFDELRQLIVRIQTARAGKTPDRTARHRFRLAAECRLGTTERVPIRAQTEKRDCSRAIALDLAGWVLAAGHELAGG